jgi:hypothetical protein
MAFVHKIIVDQEGFSSPTQSVSHQKRCGNILKDTRVEENVKWL